MQSRIHLSAAMLKSVGIGGLLLSSLLPAFGQDEPIAVSPPIGPIVPVITKPAARKKLSNPTVKLPNGKTFALPYQTVNGRNTMPTGVPSFQNGVGYGSKGVQRGIASSQAMTVKGGTSMGLAFHSGLFIPPAGERIQPALAAAAHRQATQRLSAENMVAAQELYGLIQFKGAATDELRASLTGAGVEILGFYPNNAFLARIPANALTKLAQLPAVQWVGQPSPLQKMHREVALTMVNAANSRAAATRPGRYIVSFYTEDADGSMRSDLSAVGANLGRYDKGIAIQSIEATPNMLQKIAELNHVLFIEPVGQLHTLNEFGSSDIGADYMWGVNDLTSGYQTKVGHLDTGWYAYHSDFSKLLSPAGGFLGYSLISGESCFDDLNGHGTHTGGTIGGEGNANFRYRGVAAGLHSNGNGAVPDLLIAQVLDKTGHGSWDTFIQGMDLLDAGSGNAGYKRDVWNASIGGGGFPSDAVCRKVDQVFGDNILPVVAAGNDGPGVNTIGAPGCAKGALTVGAVYSDDYNSASVQVDDLTYFSSRGPGDPSYGRIHKPDVLAPGAYIDSVAHGTVSGYLYDWAGTSMATPHVTGLAAGLIGHYPGWPAWVYKAIILANTVNPGGDRNSTGFGKVDANLANYSIDGSWNTWWWNQGGTNSVSYVDLYLDHPVAQLRVIMTYPDPPAAAGATNVLVNDLDLGVQYSAASSGLTTTWSYNWGDASYDPTSAVTINNAAAGYYRIKVHGYNVPSGSQRVAVAARWIDSKVVPSISTAFSAPYAVQPNQTFYAYGYATPDAYVASSIEGTISLDSSISNQGPWLNRRSNPSSAAEWIFLPDGGAYYEYNHLSMGSTPRYNQRQAAWTLKSGTSEGAKALSFTTRSVNSIGDSASASVIVDGTPPVFSNVAGEHWTTTKAADVYATVQDTLSGLIISSAQYRYSKNNGSSWSSWATAPCTGSDRTTAAQTIKIPAVPFGQMNTNNKVELTITDAAGNVQDQTFTINSGILKSLSVPSSIPGGTTATGTVTLTAAAPLGGAKVILTNTNAKASVPSSVTVAAGSTTATFSIAADSVTTTSSGSITAAYAGVSFSKTYTVRIPQFTSIKLSPTTVVGGVQNSVGTVVFDGPAAANTTVSLSSSSAAASVPASVVVAAGSTTATFTVTSHGVTAQQKPVITGKVGTNSHVFTLTVNPVALSSIKLNPSTVKGGVSSVATITLSHAAIVPITVTLSSSSTSVAAPASTTITIPAGQTSKTVTINTFAVATNQSVVITAATPAGSKTATLKVTP